MRVCASVGLRPCTWDLFTFFHLFQRAFGHFRAFIPTYLCSRLYHADLVLFIATAKYAPSTSLKSHLQSSVPVLRLPGGSTITLKGSM